jgi:hypothetical protein
MANSLETASYREKEDKVREIVLREYPTAVWWHVNENGKIIVGIPTGE